MSSDHEKTLAAKAASELVEDGMLVGLGTGSTSEKMVHFVGQRIQAGELSIEAICTSSGTEKAARQYGIPICSLSNDRPIDLYLDGADEIDGEGSMIKGGGGALLREKLVATHATRRVIMTDSSKQVECLGRAFKLPVEIVRFGFATTIDRIKKTARCEVHLRLADGELFVTDEGHYIVDCELPDGIASPRETDLKIVSIPGVVETGLFIDLCDELIVGSGDSVIRKSFARRG